jgi:predicted TPR repeat methyltransferase
MTDWLEQVYEATGDIERLEKAYDGWAEGYDDSVAALGYTNPALVAALFSRLMPDVDGPILDAGCGTGVIGQILSLAGYTMIDGIDLSGGMLKRAEARGVYRKLGRAVLGEPLEMETASYTGVVSSGVFTVGHAPASAFDEIARVMTPGGVFVVSITDPAFESGGFGDAMARLEQAGLWVPAATSGSYLPLPNAEPAHRHPGKVYALRRV